MASPLNNRISPQIIINDKSEQPSVSYSTRPSLDKEINKHENGIQTMIDTSLENSHQTTRIIQV
jgi:hypothetical protein